MAESTRPGAGGATCYGSMPELKERKIVVGDGVTATNSATMPILHDANHAAYIVGIDVFVITNPTSANAGTLDVGTAADPDAVVDAASIMSSASYSIGDVHEMTLVTTTASVTGSSTGFFRLPAGTTLLATYTTGGANNGRWLLQCTYVLLDKGIG